MHKATRTPHAPAPLAADLRARLAAEVKRDGDENVRRRIGLARDSFGRALGGLSVARGTAAIIASALSAPTDPAPLVVRETAGPRAAVPPWKGYLAATIALLGTSTAGSPTAHVRLAALAFAAIVAIVLVLRPK